MSEDDGSSAMVTVIISHGRDPDSTITMAGWRIPVEVARFFTEYLRERIGDPDTEGLTEYRHTFTAAAGFPGTIINKEQP